jgi:uncharacterized protein (TIGR02145 family)
MFANTKNLTNIDISGFNTRSVKNIDSMFSGTVITELDLSNFDTTSLTSVASVVYSAQNLETIYVSQEADFAKASGYAPYYGTKLVGGAGTRYEYYLSLHNEEAGRIDDPDNNKRGLFTLKDSRYIRYDANGGEGTMTSHYVNVSATSTDKLHANEFTKENSEFLNWNTEPDGTGTTYTDEQAMSGVESSKTPLTLYAIWGAACPNGTVCYKPNADNATGTMSDQNIDLDTSTFQASSPNYKREGYGFGGWNTKPDGSGINYASNERIETPESGSLKLYANWIQSTGTIQNFDCSTLNDGEKVALTDSRDGNVYVVAKLKDHAKLSGKCWMTENLRLDLAANGDKINATNTNNPSSSFITAVNGKPASADTWCNTDNAACDNQILYNNSNLTDSDKVYSQGVYYNWYTATAGNGVYAFEGDAAGDICPSGWRLPNNNDDDEEFYYTVFDANQSLVGNNYPDRYPNALTYSGNYSGSTIENLNTIGSFWSSTASSYSNVKAVDIYNNGRGVYPLNYLKKKYSGFSVRCITKD